MGICDLPKRRQRTGRISAEMAQYLCSKHADINANRVIQACDDFIEDDRCLVAPVSDREDRITPRIVVLVR